MSNFLGCLVGCFFGNLIYDIYFNKNVDKKMQESFNKRWYE